MLAVDTLGAAVDGQGANGRGISRQRDVDRIGNSLCILQLIQIVPAREEGDPLHVKRLADALGNGPQQGLRLPEGTSLLGKLNQYLIDRVSLAKEAPVDPKRKRPRYA